MAEIVHREKPFEAATPKRARTARQSERRKISGDTAADVLGKAALAPERQGEEEGGRGGGGGGEGGEDRSSAAGRERRGVAPPKAERTEFN